MPSLSPQDADAFARILASRAPKKPAEPTRVLNPSRKKDRAEMVRLLRATATKTGTTVTVTEEGSSPYYRRSFHFEAHGARGLNCSLSVDATGQNARNGVYVMAWHMDTKSDERLSTAFESRIGSVNLFHRHKATTVLRSFDTVLTVLHIGLTMAADGTAFETRQGESTP